MGYEENDIDCDGIPSDEDCDDWNGLDKDCDGYSFIIDCDDNNPSIFNGCESSDDVINMVSSVKTILVHEEQWHYRMLGK